MNWYARQRQNWIGEMLRIYGFINRSHIVAKFGCSPQAAGKDLTLFQNANASWVEYDPRRKAYVYRPGATKGTDRYANPHQRKSPVSEGLEHDPPRHQGARE